MSAVASRRPSPTPKLAVTGWYGSELSYRHMVGVDPLPELVDARETTLE